MANVTIKKGGIERVVDNRTLERWKAQGWEEMTAKGKTAKAEPKEEKG